MTLLTILKRNGFKTDATKHVDIVVFFFTGIQIAYNVTTIVFPCHAMNSNNQNYVFFRLMSTERNTKTIDRARYDVAIMTTEKINLAVLHDRKSKID